MTMSVAAYRDAAARRTAVARHEQSVQLANLIRDYMAVNGLPPTVRWMAATLGKNASTTMTRLRQAVDAGQLRHVGHGTSRAYVPTRTEVDDLREWKASAVEELGCWYEVGRVLMAAADYQPRVGESLAEIALRLARQYLDEPRRTA